MPEFIESQIKRTLRSFALMYSAYRYITIYKIQRDIAHWLLIGVLEYVVLFIKDLKFYSTKVLESAIKSYKF